MKFMKLGSKPDSFRSDEDNVRYVASELATDTVVIVGEVKFYLHKFPLLSKSARLQKLVTVTSEIHIADIPGGAAAFEMCAKFCYGMTVTLSPYNVIAARCAAEYLEMYESIEKGNLIYKIDVFLNSSIFRTWKDSIIVYQTTRSFLPWSEELKIVSHCLDSIGSKVSINTSNVEWSYTYNRKNPNELKWDGVKKQPVVPKDWWIEDLCELHIDLFKRVIMTIKTKGGISPELIGESLKAYFLRRELNKVVIQGNDVGKNRNLVNTVISLLPTEKNSVGCSFLLELLQVSIALECDETEITELKRRIGEQLDSATTADLIFKVSSEESAICNIDIVLDIVKDFVVHEQIVQNDFAAGSGFLSNPSRAKVAKLVDGYLAEIARDPNLPVSKFVDLAETVSGFTRASHDGLYRAIDTYLKEHEGISKSERKRMCRLMDCKKLSSDACTHAVQNERLPLRVVVQILFFEQMRATSSASGCSTPDLPGPVRAALLPGGSHGSSRSTTTNTEDEEWDSVPTAEDLKAITGQLSTIRLRHDDEKLRKAKGLVMSKKMFSKLWSSKDKSGENSSSDTSESPCSTQSTTTPSRSRRQSLS